MCDINNYKKIINFMENTSDRVGPKVSEFIEKIPMEIVNHINSKIGEIKLVFNEGVWKCDNSAEKVKISFNGFGLERKNYVKSSSLELMLNDLSLNSIASADVAKFSQKIYNGEECVRSIDAKFNVKQITKNNFICNYDLKHFNSQYKIPTSFVQTSISL